MSIVANLRIIRQEVAVVNQLKLLLNQLGNPRAMIPTHPRQANSRMKIQARRELPPSPSKTLQKLESPSRTRPRVPPFPRAKAPEVVASQVLMVLAR